MTAPDGRKFTSKEWFDYLKAHPGSTEEPYRCEDGTVYECDGFRFNVHGCCRNPHTFRIEPDGGRIAGQRVYCDCRTYRQMNRKLGKVVWYFNTFSIGCSVNVFGYTEDDEAGTILYGLRKARESAMQKIDRCKRAIENMRINGLEYDSGYPAEMARERKMLKLIEEEIENRMQLTLFDI